MFAHNSLMAHLGSNLFARSIVRRSATEYAKRSTPVTSKNHIYHSKRSTLIERFQPAIHVYDRLKLIDANTFGRSRPILLLFQSLQSVLGSLVRGVKIHNLLPETDGGFLIIVQQMIIAQIAIALKQASQV